MRKNCVKLVEIRSRRGGNEQIFCTIPHTILDYPSAKPAFLTQLTRKSSQAFPHSKTVTRPLLKTTFCPLSTTPINTITIHIN